VGTLATGAGYLSALLPGDAPGWAPWALAWGIGALLAGLLLLGATRQGRVPVGPGWVFLLTGLWISAGLSVLLALPGVDAADAPLFLGLPRRAAFLLLGVGLAPGFVLPVAYGVIFRRHTLSEEDLARLHEVAARVAAATGEDAPDRPRGGRGSTRPGRTE
jgi:hypothetical protein